MSALLDLTSEYLSQGWSILPVRPEEKRPFMQNWLQYTKTKADRNTALSWFTNLTGAGVGVVTGKVSNIVVLDIEHHCPTPLNDLLKRYPTNLVAETGGGGYHLFYQYPQNVSKVSNRVRLFEGADLRADGGFIVLPPTRHPNGNCYEWLTKGPPGVFPLELLEIQSAPKMQNDGWITETLRGVTEGGRNDACARLAGYFFKKGVNADIVEALLMEWNERNDPPLPTGEVRTVIKSIERSHATGQSLFTSVEFDAKGTQQNTFDVLRMKDYIRGYGGEGVSWLVQDWLPDKSVTFLVSPPESYKTWMLLDLVVSITTGAPFLNNFEVRHTGPALIIQQEDSHQGLTERLALIVEQRLGLVPKIDGKIWQVPVIPDLPIYIHPSRMLRFDNKEVLAELEEQIAVIRPKVVIIDPLYSTTSVDNYMAASAEQMMVLKSWRDKYGCSFIIAHHSKKNVDPDSTAREDSWGSQFLNAFLEAGWQIRRNPRLAQNEIVVRRHSKVMGNLAPVSLTFDISTVYPMQYTVGVQQYTATTSTPMPAQAALLEMFRDGGTLSQKDISDRTGKSRSTISRQVKQLESAGLVERMPSGKFKLKEGEQ